MILIYLVSMKLYLEKIAVWEKNKFVNAILIWVDYLTLKCRLMMENKKISIIMMYLYYFIFLDFIKKIFNFY